MVQGGIVVGRSGLTKEHGGEDAWQRKPVDPPANILNAHGNACGKSEGNPAIFLLKADITGTEVFFGLKVFSSFLRCARPEGTATSLGPL
eukprot:1149320-Pelagomonas_calceolata.AAC.1